MYISDSIMPINNPTDVNIILRTCMNAFYDTDVELKNNIPYRVARGSVLL